jgi:hypothetical protein
MNNRFPHTKFDYRGGFWALTIALVGFGFLWMAANLEFFCYHKGLQSISHSLAGFLITSVAIGLVLQLYGKRAFLKDILGQTQLSEDVRAAGLLRIGMDYVREVDWENMFKTVKKLDIFFAYGRSWRRDNGEHLASAAKRGGLQVRVVLPNPDKGEVVSQLAVQFNQKPDHLRAYIQEAKIDFDEKFECLGSRYSISYFDEHPAFSYYRFDNIAVVAFYSNRRPYKKPPILQLESAGTLYKFFKDEFDYILKESHK